MFSNRSFKTLINTSNLINISTSMTILQGLDTFSSGFKTLLDTEYFDNIASRLDDKAKSNFSSSSLVYSVNNNMSQFDNTDLIINLLLQIRAIQNGQNSFVKSVSTVKDQVIDQLQRELLFAKSYLNPSQINQIKVIIENNASNEGDFDKLLSSLYGNLKKKIVEQGNSKKFSSIAAANTIETQYDALTQKVLSRQENIERLSTRVNLVNIETNKEQIEELKTKLSEKLERVYERNIEESIKDSYEVLSKKEVEEKVLNRLIENIRQEEKEKLRTLRREEKQKEIEKILRNKLEQIYETRIEESLKDSIEVLTKSEVRKEIIERLQQETNIVLKQKEIKPRNIFLEKGIETQYDALTQKVLSRQENIERLSTRVNLVNIETNKEQIEELKTKLSEKLERVYERNIEESIKDSYEVLSKKEVEEKVLNRLIENIRQEEKEKLRTLRREEKQKEIEKILRNELEQIYETRIEESLKDSIEVLTKSEVRKEIIERLQQETNIVLKQKEIKPRNIVLEKGIETQYDALTQKVLSRQENIERLSTRVNLVNIETKKENLSLLKSILGTNSEKTVSKIINKGVNVLKNETVANFEYNKNSDNEVIENQYLNKIIEKYKINTVFKENDTKKLHRAIVDRRLDYLKNESGALENTFEIVGKKLSNMIPKNKKISTLDFNSIINTKRTVEDNSYIDLPSSPMVYYNDAVERIGQNLLTGINNTPGNFSGTTEKMVHKAPVKIPLSKDDDDRDVYEGQSVLESQLLGKSYASMQQGNNRNKLSSNKNVMNEEKTKRLIKDYVSELDLNIDSISRKVMNRIEKIMKTDRRRFGMFR